MKNLAKIELPIVILAIAQSSKEHFLKYLSKEFISIRNSLKEAEENNLCQLIEIPFATLDQIIDAFKKYQNKVAIFHFSGHANAYSLILENEFQNKYQVFADGFSSFLAEQSGLKLVFLNACSTSTIAHKLTDKGISAVIHTESLVKDAVAYEIGAYFYQFLSVGNSIMSSFKQATSIVNTKYGSKSNFRALYKKSTSHKGFPWSISFNKENLAIGKWNFPDITDQPLYTLPKIKPYALPDSPFPGLKPYLSNGTSLFQGRDNEIKYLYDWCIKGNESAVFIGGANGVGKTSLIFAGLIPRLKANYKVLDFNFKEKTNNLEILTKQLQDTSGDNLAFIVFDHLNHSKKSKITNLIAQVIVSHPNLKFIICLRSRYIKQWQTELQPISQHINTFILSPIRAQNIRKVINNLITKRELIDKYKIEYESGLEEVIISWINNDQQAPKLPLLQLILNKMWVLSKNENLNQIYFSKELFFKTISIEHLISFIQHLLKRGEKYTAYNESGFIFNLLYHIISNKDCTIKDIKNNFKLKNEELDSLIDFLKEVYIISSPATESINDGDKLRIAHERLEVPILNLLLQSNRLGQESKRILEHHSNRDTTLSQKQLILLRQGENLLPNLSTKEQEILQRSQIKWKKVKNRRTNKLLLKIFVVVSILGFGLFINDPYLLSFLILVIAIYKHR